MKTFKEFRRDALRYRALKSTDGASPWRDVLGGHPNIDSLADALVKVCKMEEDAPAMSIGSGAGLAGLTGDPPVSRRAQRKWTLHNGILRRKAQG